MNISEGFLFNTTRTDWKKRISRCQIKKQKGQSKAFEDGFGNEAVTQKVDGSFET